MANIQYEFTIVSGNISCISDILQTHRSNGWEIDGECATVLDDKEMKIVMIVPLKRTIDNYSSLYNDDDLYPKNDMNELDYVFTKYLIERQNRQIKAFEICLKTMFILMGSAICFYVLNYLI